MEDLVGGSAGAASTAKAVVAVDSTQTIIVWSRGTEALLGRAAADAVGRKCYDVIGGRLPSGKRLCRADCSVRRRARRMNSLRDFDIVVRHATGRHLVLAVSSVAIQAEHGGCCTVHFVQHAAGRECSETSLARLTSPPLSDVTRREADVLSALGRGMSTREVASALWISPLTVQTHVRNLLRKKNLHSQMQLALFALRNGLS